ncbi:MAG: hypothetical protein IJM51_10730 [Clostridia bacterium]|nr:hypothetical protein [Clostridia bacterium]
MQFSLYFIIIALGCFVGAALMFTRFRDHAAVTYPTGVLLILAGIYLLCREFISGFAESPVGSWVARGVLVIFLIYLLLSWNNLKAERSEEPAEPPEKSDDTD